MLGRICTTVPERRRKCVGTQRGLSAHRQSSPPILLPNPTPFPSLPHLPPPFPLCGPRPLPGPSCALLLRCKAAVRQASSAASSATARRPLQTPASLSPPRPTTHPSPPFHSPPPFTTAPFRISLGTSEPMIEAVSGYADPQEISGGSSSRMAVPPTGEYAKPCDAVAGGGDASKIRGYTVAHHCCAGFRQLRL